MKNLRKFNVDLYLNMWIQKFQLEQLETISNINETSEEGK
jgi:hypothetical protein